MALTAERPFMHENDLAAAEAGLHVGRLSLQHEIVQRGDRQLPDEPNRGFTIERLEGASMHGSIPIGEAFPNSTDAKAKDFAQQYIDGRTPIEIVEDAWEASDMGLRPSFMVYFPVAASKYQEAVASGEARPGLFGEEGKVSRVKPGAEALDALVSEGQKRAALEKYYAPQAKAVQKNYVDDLNGISAEGLADLPGLLEAYDFTDGGKDIRLLNLTETRLSDEQLRQVTNVIRSFSDKSGGELFDKLRTILILPEDNPRLSLKVTDEQGEFDLPHAGEARDGSIFISERAVQRPDDRKPRSDRVEKYWAKAYNDQLLPGEPEQGPGSPKYNASRWNLEPLLAHEMEHIVLPPNDVELEGPGPTLYSRFRKREHEAELGALEYIGWQDVQESLDVPEAERQAKVEQWENQRAAKQEMWDRQRGSDDGGQTYKAPLGPRFIVCRELDVTKGPLPTRLKRPDRPLATEINYRLIPEA